jgi:hypothetical protein
MTEREALRLALEWVEGLKNSQTLDEADAFFDRGEELITAIREILAQPEQEPVAWMHPDEYKTYFTTDPSEDLLLNGYWTPLYTTSPKREPEPVAWIDKTCLKNLSNDFEPTISKNPVSEFDVPLYTQIGTKNDIQ